MTLVLSVYGPASMWTLVDRRLSYVGRPPRDDARKMMFLETTDATAILSYAGLGETVRGTEPADWLSAVLRGRKVPLEQALGIVAEALKREFPIHLERLRGSAHTVVAAALVGREQRFYTIDLVSSPDRTSYKFRYTRHVTVSGKAPRIMFGGSGATYLAAHKDWQRPLIRLVNAYDFGRVRPSTVAEHLAALNYRVHLALADKSVGPRCIVAWRHTTPDSHTVGAGQACYSSLSPDQISVSLPVIGSGMDVTAICDLLMSRYMKNLNAGAKMEAVFEFDKDEMNQALSRLPHEPDEKLD